MPGARGSGSRQRRQPHSVGKTARVQGSGCLRRLDRQTARYVGREVPRVETQGRTQDPPCHRAHRQHQERSDLSRQDQRTEDHPDRFLGGEQHIIV